LGAVGLIAAGTSAWASIPDADGVIHGCFKTASGDLRIIDAATESCAGNETAISWNQGLRGWEIKGETTETNSDGVKSVLAHCSRGKDILGGGAHTHPHNIPAIALDTSAPSSPGVWVAAGHEVFPTAQEWRLEAWVICANLTP
jgi:hypothetical protein